jgi:hypothetical protein
MNDTQQPARPYFRTPAISPDDTLVAFVHAADIWIVPVTGGVAEGPRLPTLLARRRSDRV